MIVVDADDEIRVRRAMQQGMDEADVGRRMASQPSRAEWLAAADLVVPNHGDLRQWRRPSLCSVIISKADSGRILSLATGTLRPCPSSRSCPTSLPLVR